VTRKTGYRLLASGFREKNATILSGIRMPGSSRVAAYREKSFRKTS
jgi:hypothetical protein